MTKRACLPPPPTEISESHTHVPDPTPKTPECLALDVRKIDAKQNTNSVSGIFENESIVRRSLGRYERSTQQEKTSQITVPPTTLKESAEVGTLTPQTEGKEFGA